MAILSTTKIINPLSFLVILPEFNLSLQALRLSSKSFGPISSFVLGVYLHAKNQNDPFIASKDFQITESCWSICCE